MSDKIPTAEEIIQEYDSSIKNNHLTRVAHAARKLVQFHVEAALKAAIESGIIEFEPNDYDGSTAYIVKDSILNAYPKENIL